MARKSLCVVRKPKASSSRELRPRSFAALEDDTQGCRAQRLKDLAQHNLRRVLPRSSIKKFLVLFSKRTLILNKLTNRQIKIRNSIYKNISSRSNASSTSSLWAKDENLKNPSPCIPNPTPGVPTTPVSFKRRSKKSQDDALNGILNHK